MAEVVQVETRQLRGKRNARRMRHDGSIPAVLYGHGLETIALSIPAEQIDAAVRRGVRVVELAGAVSESALIRELQWDTWGLHILHIDFGRISADETVELSITVELRGEAPGIKEGGIVKQLIHEIQVDCKATAIPEKLDANVNKLKLNESLTVADIELPEGVKYLGDPAAVIVHCVEPAEVLEEEAGAVEAEPEVIGRKEEEEGEGKKT